MNYSKLLFGLAVALTVACQAPQQEQASAAEQNFFQHGVASGDPLADRVIIWTRVSDTQADEVPVSYEVSTSEDFSTSVKKGTTQTHAGRDYTVKVDVDGLEAGQTYFYRFQVGQTFSPTGRTKTLSQQADSLQFAVVSCSNYEWGYFTAYGKIAERPVLDAVIHLGDYIYEYGPGAYGDTTIGRKHEPAHEILTLEDYRTRYAQYRTDKDLQAMHGAHPFIAIWDDHEIANNTYQTGAQNHQEDEGDFEARKQAAVQTYYEWLPIREGAHYRSFQYGDLASLIMLDERLAGRTEPAKGKDDPKIDDQNQSMLGAEQLEWFKSELNSSASWKVIGNQVMYSDLYQEPVWPNFPINTDSWSGYRVEKNAIAQYILDQEVENVVFLTGDTHASWAFEVLVSDVSDEAVATEFGTTSVSSANHDERKPLDTVRATEQRFYPHNEHLKYVNLADHGYLMLTVAAEEARAEFYYVNDLRNPGGDEYRAKTFRVKAGTSTISE
ncbi:alkaline phosphatase D family protein [Marinoscillum furvescens]|uniref:Alkaline phosphatase D n=1 Tax=Marinoscillum furvescens DSM 4134 TaxID=1122208 RepID=A0A3D9LHC7_MARFU|nr:alkaline phosphatase D family protein [Marinoscillum furvescens]REE05811.1 alkaline phosphatase D [Marinoscillum furvescens DSM 4134]